MRAILVLLLLPRLLVIGDSLTQGLAASGEERTFKAVLATGMGASLGSVRITRLEDAEGLSFPWQPDMIVLEIGLNDSLTPTMGEEAWRTRYAALLDKLKATGATVVVATPFRGISPAHPDFARVARYAESIKEAAAARGIAVADLWALECACRSTPADLSPFPPYYHGDNFHPNDEGHRRIAGAILRAFRPYTVYLPRA